MTRLGNLGTARRYGLGAVHAVKAGFRWHCPGCGRTIAEGRRVFEVARGVWRCLDCASPKVELVNGAAP